VVGQNPLHLLNALPLESSQGVPWDANPVGLLEAILAEDGSRGSPAATDALFAGLAEDALPDE
jgi:hypothetical protein